MKNLIEFLRYVVDPRKAKLALIIALGFSLALLVGCRSQQASDQAKYESEIEQLKADYEAQILDVQAQAEAGIYATKYFDDMWTDDALRLGCWLTCLDNTYPGLTVEAKQLALWCIFDRVDNDDFPPDVEDTLYQSGQFDEYDDTVVPTEDNIIIAQNQLSVWHNNGISRPYPISAVYLTISSEGVVLRNTYTETAKTSYWRA